MKSFISRVLKITGIMLIGGAIGSIVTERRLRKQHNTQRVFERFFSWLGRNVNLDVSRKNTSVKVGPAKFNISKTKNEDIVID